MASPLWWKLYYFVFWFFFSEKNAWCLECMEISMGGGERVNALFSLTIVFPNKTLFGRLKICHWTLHTHRFWYPTRRVNKTTNESYFHVWKLITTRSMFCIDRSRSQHGPWRKTPQISPQLSTAQPSPCLTTLLGHCCLWKEGGCVTVVLLPLCWSAVWSCTWRQFMESPCQSLSGLWIVWHRSVCSLFLMWFLFLA